MFYDVEEPNLFCKTISKILDKKGIWALEFSYFPLLLKNLTYDQICHEHCVYYSLITFNNIIRKHGLKIIDFQLNEINGGSIEVICAKTSNNFPVNINKINALFQKEREIKNINTNTTSTESTSLSPSFVLSLCQTHYQL